VPVALSARHRRREEHAAELRCVEGLCGTGGARQDGRRGDARIGQVAWQSPDGQPVSPSWAAAESRIARDKVMAHARVVNGTSTHDPAHTTSAVQCPAPRLVHRPLSTPPRATGHTSSGATQATTLPRVAPAHGRVTVTGAAP
jgi:hypothetical protein